MLCEHCGAIVRAETEECPACGFKRPSVPLVGFEAGRNDEPPAEAPDGASADGAGAGQRPETPRNADDSPRAGDSHRARDSRGARRREEADDRAGADEAGDEKERRGDRTAWVVPGPHVVCRFHDVDTEEFYCPACGSLIEPVDGQGSPCSACGTTVVIEFEASGEWLASPDAAPTDAGWAARRVANLIGLEWAEIPAGHFTMGALPDDRDAANDEVPAHQVYLRSTFWLSRSPVTVAQYRAFAKATGRAMPLQPWEQADESESASSNTDRAPEPPDESDEVSTARWDHCPVVYVTWEDAQAFSEWVGGRLPTEAEWEYAARAGERTLYTWGDEPDAEAARCAEDDVAGSVTPVGSYESNGLGLVDMLGNVEEWVADWYDPAYYAGSPRHDPPGPDAGKERVTRGGSWCSEWPELRISRRGHAEPDEAGNDLGFRCARD